MPSKAATVEEFLAELPEDRRAAISALREVLLANLNEGFAEGMQYGGIGYFIPHTLYPAGYHCDPKQPLPFIGLANQKGHMALHLFCLYIDESGDERFREEWAKTGKKLDMGKACLRFKKVDDLALDVIGDTIKSITMADFVAHYEEVLNRSKSRK